MLDKGVFIPESRIMSNTRKRNGGSADGRADVISVVSNALQQFTGFAHSSLVTKRDMHEDEMEELVVGLIAVQDEFQRSLAPRNLPSFRT
jgi:hypothetical protein